MSKQPRVNSGRILTIGVIACAMHGDVLLNSNPYTRSPPSKLRSSPPYGSYIEWHIFLMYRYAHPSKFYLFIVFLQLVALHYHKLI